MQRGVKRRGWIQCCIVCTKTSESIDQGGEGSRQMQNLIIQVRAVVEVDGQKLVYAGNVGTDGCAYVKLGPGEAQKNSREAAAVSETSDLICYH